MLGRVSTAQELFDEKRGVVFGVHILILGHRPSILPTPSARFKAGLWRDIIIYTRATNRFFNWQTKHLCISNCRCFQYAFAFALQWKTRPRVSSLYWGNRKGFFNSKILTASSPAVHFPPASRSGNFDAGCPRLFPSGKWLPGLSLRR